MRLDVYLVDKSLVQTRQRAKTLISDGRVTVNSIVCQKPSKDVTEGDIVEIAPTDEYEFVSRGGYKLSAAIEHFGLDVCGFVAADLGASSGGFTDCLLLHGVRKVYAVDCGSGQLAAKLKDDPRVISMENTNARALDEGTFDDSVDLVVMDLSFISQTLVFPAVSKVLKKDGIFVSLIKPQFEVGRSGIGKNGIVKSEKIRAQAVEKVVENAKLFGFVSRGVIESPIKGGDGNIEYLCVFDYR